MGYYPLSSPVREHSRYVRSSSGEMQFAKHINYLLTVKVFTLILSHNVGAFFYKKTRCTADGMNEYLGNMRINISSCFCLE